MANLMEPRRSVGSPDVEPSHRVTHQDHSQRLGFTKKTFLLTIVVVGAHSQKNLGEKRLIASVKVKHDL